MLTQSLAVCAYYFIENQKMKVASLTEFPSSEEQLSKIKFLNNGTYRWS